MDRKLDFSFTSSMAARVLDEATRSSSPLQKKVMTASTLVQRFYAWRKGSQLRQQEQGPSTPLKSSSRELVVREPQVGRNNSGMICANDNSRLQWEQDYVNFLEMKQQEIEDKRQQITAVLQDAAHRKLEVETIADKIRSLEKHLREADKQDLNDLETRELSRVATKELKKRRTSAISQILSATSELEQAAKNAVGEDQTMQLMELREELKVKSSKFLELETIIQKLEIDQKIMKDLLSDKNEVMKEKDEIVRNKENEINLLQQKLNSEKDSLFQLLHEKEAELQQLKISEQSRFEAALEKHNKELKIHLKEFQSRYQDEFNLRKKYYNQLQELKGNIRVFCRVRPLNENEGQNIIEFPIENVLQIKDKKFEFDKIFSSTVTQEEVFNEVKPLVCSVLDGFNGCIFAYGQTGSGKSYTMEGPSENRGVNFRALTELFNITNNRKTTHHYFISVGMMEIYNEQLRDLLTENDSHKKLEIKQGQQGIFVPELTNIIVNSMEDIWNIMKLGSNNRSVSATDCNEYSSRSHSILSISVSGENLCNGATLHSRLYLVDLAGSERVAISGVTGDRLKEAQHINKSLSLLGTVVASLVQKNPHIPYRDSKLTYLLKDCLGGDSKTLMFVQVSPSELSELETLSSLKFASRVKNVENGPAKQNINDNTVSKLREEGKKFKEELKQKDDKIEELKLNYRAAQKSGEDTVAKLNEREKDVRQLKIQLEEMKEKISTQQQQIQNQLQVIKQSTKTKSELEHFHLIPPPVPPLDQLLSPEVRVEKQDTITSPVPLDFEEQSKDKENMSENELNGSVAYLISGSILDKRKVHFADSPADKPSLKRKDIQSPFNTPSRKVKPKIEKTLDILANIPKPILAPSIHQPVTNSPFIDRQQIWSKSLRGSTSVLTSRKPSRVPVKSPKTPPPRRVLARSEE